MMTAHRLLAGMVSCCISMSLLAQAALSDQQLPAWGYVQGPQWQPMQGNLNGNPGNLPNWGPGGPPPAAPVNPAPVHPAPVNPAPVHPAPVNPAPVHPAPVNPAPVHPAPVNPAPVNPAPVNPAPVNPAPVNPAPNNPAPGASYSPPSNPGSGSPNGGGYSTPTNSSGGTPYSGSTGGNQPSSGLPSGGSSQPTSQLPFYKLPQGVASLQDCITSGAATCNLLGDGQSTAQSTLQITNQTPQPLSIYIPPYQCFVPTNPGYQTMMTTSPTMCSLQPNQTIQTVVNTLCASTKSLKPPPASGGSYQCASYPNPALYPYLCMVPQLVAALSNANFYNGLPIPASRRDGTVAQMAIWKHLGQLSSLPGDAVNEQCISDDILQRAGVSPQSLTSQQRQEFDSSVAQIFNKVDLTDKYAQTCVANGMTPQQLIAVLNTSMP